MRKTVHVRIDIDCSPCAENKVFFFITQTEVVTNAGAPKRELELQLLSFVIDNPTGTVAPGARA